MIRLETLEFDGLTNPLVVQQWLSGNRKRCELSASGMTSPTLVCQDSYAFVSNRSLSLIFYSKGLF